MSFVPRTLQSRSFLDSLGASRSNSPGAASSMRTRDRYSGELENDHHHERDPLLSPTTRQARRLGLTFDVNNDDADLHGHARMRESIYSHHRDRDRDRAHADNRASISRIFTTEDSPENSPDNHPDQNNNLIDGSDDRGDIDVENVTDNVPLLPIFSAHQLESIPIFQLTHSIRLLITSRCDTTLSWDQLRSPQVSQFLLKPMQQEIRSTYLSRATLYALLANALQFSKEAAECMAIAGSSKTRAMICELLAIKLMKEYRTGELVEALSYDFDPLMGQEAHDADVGPSSAGDNNAAGKGLRFPIGPAGSAMTGTARISCLEIAIRAQAKHFLAHPLVVRQLEAIWAGNIVFHSLADSLHRLPASVEGSSRKGFGSQMDRSTYPNFFLRGSSSGGGDCRSGAGGGKGIPTSAHTPSRYMPSRRSVTLYNPRDASLFKLSRLRVPRYRAALSTISFAMLLLLFLAVLRRQALEITGLELTFWFWSAGYMLDEVVGFNEQGFSLYIMSFWNVFDLGILILLFSYSCLRIASILVSDIEQHRVLAAQAYDVLASCAVLLLPRLFSVLDHVRYFSQLLIAFRMMTADLLAISILIIICCSGFFVAFTFAFNTLDESPGEVVYELFQMLMGFTPTAWALWDRNDLAGRFVLVCFMFISHFLIVTILVTVLTNSFMAVVQNADEEHQFLFAVNTISMVKSDALFAYIAPTNVIAWIVSPLRYLMAFRNFVKLNRTIIKATHFPVLFIIYVYERFLLSRTSWAYVVNDFFDEDNGQDREATIRAQKSRNNINRTFGGRLVREPSVATFRKDQALEEVFRRPYKGDDTRSLIKSPVVLGLGIDLGQQRTGRNNAVNVDNWMETLPEENSSSARDFNSTTTGDMMKRYKTKRKNTKLTSRPRFRIPSRTYATMRYRGGDATISVASDPEDLHSSFGFPTGVRRGGGTGGVSSPPVSRLASQSSLLPSGGRLRRRIWTSEVDDEQHEGDDENDNKFDREADASDEGGEEDDDDDDEQEHEHEAEDEDDGDDDEAETQDITVTGQKEKENSDVSERQAAKFRNGKRPVRHSSSEDDDDRNNVPAKISPDKLSSARGSRPVTTTASTSQRSSRPSTPRIPKPPVTLNQGLTKSGLTQISRMRSHENSGSDSLGDETDGESEESEAAVIMRSPPRNSGTANPNVANFGKRKLQHAKNGDAILEIGRGLDTRIPSGVPALRPRSGSISTMSRAWADDGQSTAAIPPRRPEFSRTNSHPTRRSGLAAPPSPLPPMALDVASDLGDNKAIGNGLVGAVPSSFATQMAYATGGLRREPSLERNTSTQDLLSRLVLARMKTLEEGFQQVVREVKDLKIRDERVSRREREREWERERERDRERRVGRGLSLGTSVPMPGPASFGVQQTQGCHYGNSSALRRRPSRKPHPNVAGKGKEKLRESRRSESTKPRNKASNPSAAYASTAINTAASSDVAVAVAVAAIEEASHTSTVAEAAIKLPSIGAAGEDPDVHEVNPPSQSADGIAEPT